MGLSTALAAFYFGDDMGTKTMLDHSGNGKHLSHNGAVTTGGVAVFTAGSVQRAQEPNTPANDFAFLRDEWTIGMQIKVVSGAAILSVRAGATGQSLRILQAASTLSVRLSNNGTSEVNVNIPYTLGTSVFLTVTYDGTNISITDGTNTSTGTLAGPLYEIATPRLRIANYDTSYATINISNLGFWSRVLSAGELTELRGGWLPSRMQKGNIPMVFCIGQSNLSGEAADATLIPVGVQDTLQNTTTFYGNTKKALGGISTPKWNPRTDDGLGYDLSLASAMPAGWAMYSHGISGTNIASWQSGQSSYVAAKAGYDAAVADLEAMGFAPYLALVVWTQGEADANVSVPHATDYANQLTTLIATVRANIGDCPWIVTKLPTAFDAHYPYVAEIQASQDLVGQQVRDVTIADVNAMVELEAGEPNHWSATSAIKIGRFLAKLIPLKINPPGLTTLLERLTETRAAKLDRDLSEVGDEMSLNAATLANVATEVDAGDATEANQTTIANAVAAIQTEVAKVVKVGESIAMTNDDSNTIANITQTRNA